MLAAVAAHKGIESDLIPRIATVFCSGQAQMGGQCGALTAGLMAGLSEAVRFADAGGLDMDKVLDAVSDPRLRTREGRAELAKIRSYLPPGAPKTSTLVGWRGTRRPLQVTTWRFPVIPDTLT